jgi:trehalose 6-phosphate synthase
MNRVVLVSNRVADLAHAPQAGGVAVALAGIGRAHHTLWFGWSGEIKPPEEVNAATLRGERMATVPLTESEHQGYYLGYANSVLWPVFRLLWALPRRQSTHGRAVVPAAARR